MADLDPQQVQKLKALIAADAPILAKLLDGPQAALALSLLGKSLVNDAEAPLSDIVSTAEANTPDVHLKTAAAEQQGQMRLRQSQGKSDVSLAQLDPVVAKALIEESTKQQQAILGDVEGARRRSIDTHDATNKFLAYIVTILFFLLIFTLIFWGQKLMPDSMGGARDILFTLLGVVATGWTAIISFYFGSSTGSMQKSLTLDSLLQKQQKQNVEEAPKGAS
jgi:hypothetical protein